ncbi:biotin synthase auxiliary protein BsaP [Williamsia deligens]|uniref:Biotin synthase auxiliary protein n=1 Tax=Williamsia deligens TaxID=321325 RepID=A0ABW3GAF5_9NOCA|nr:hypothetical protein [Williamsia deligens]MCP2195911.1 hypothetical protein [Williamsia deligens]
MADSPLDEPLAYSVYTGVPVAQDGEGETFTAARLGLEPPRYCGRCGRRMVVQVVPTGWTARCSRHGSVDSSDPTRR